MSRNKYNVSDKDARTKDGVFDSAAEMERYAELKMMEDNRYGV
jgi:hypothetical protein